MSDELKACPVCNSPGKKTISGKCVECSNDSCWFDCRVSIEDWQSPRMIPSETATRLNDARRRVRTMRSGTLIRSIEEHEITATEQTLRECGYTVNP